MFSLMALPIAYHSTEIQIGPNRRNATGSLQRALKPHDQGIGRTEIEMQNHGPTVNHRSTTTVGKYFHFMLPPLHCVIVEVLATCACNARSEYTEPPRRLAAGHQARAPHHRTAQNTAMMAKK